jgi:L-fucose isomerase-like protein
LKIGCYHLVSNIHNQNSIDLSLQPFMESIEKYLGEPFIAISPKDIKKEPIFPVILIKSGGVEEKFKRIYQQFPSPYFLLAGCLHNALPAALEIKEYLNKRGEQVEILHGSAKWIAQRLKLLRKVMEAKKACRQYRVGVLGKPSDWLIASGADYNIIRKKLGIKIYDIPLEEMIRHIDQTKNSDIPSHLEIMPTGFDQQVIQQSLRIYQGLKNLIQEYHFNAITVRCFELIDFYKNTGCLALSLLNREGIVAGCEGDVPALVSMIIAHQLTDQPIFMANPACIDQEKNEIVFAHCTIPINMCEGYDWKTHFESGIGIAIRGKVKEGPVTLFKLDGNLDRYFLSEGELTKNLDSPHLCRSQLQIVLKEPVVNFLEKSIANHHLICKGWHREKFEKFLSLVL